MAVVFAIAIIFAGVIAAAALGLRAMRRAVAAGLIGEIAEALELMETHAVESALAQDGEGAASSPALPEFSTLVYRSESAWLALLGPHLARVVASFYAAAQALQRELSDLAAETSEARRAQRMKFAKIELQQAFDLGEDALRGLRGIVSPGRPLTVTRA